MNLRVVLCLLHTTFHGHKTMSRLRERNATSVSILASPYGNHRHHRYLGILYIVNIQQSNDHVNFHPMYLPCYSLEFKLVRV